MSGKHGNLGDGTLSRQSLIAVAGEASRARNVVGPRVSVIIPHYNDLENLKTCVALLAAQSYPRAWFEIVIGENNSACGMEAVVNACGPDARVIHAREQGAASARNAAILASQGEILAFIDSDCRPAADWLERGVEALTKSDLVGGRIDVSAADAGRPTAVEAFEQAFAFNNRRYIEKENFSVTANMFVPRAIFDLVGEFRANFSEDVDWGQRAARRGYRWRFADDAVVSHLARRDWSDLTKKWRRLTRESRTCMAERPYWRLRWFFRALLLPASPFVQWPAVFRSKGPEGFRNRLKAVGILFAIRFWRCRECLTLLLH